MWEGEDNTKEYADKTMETEAKEQLMNINSGSHSIV